MSIAFERDWAIAREARKLREEGQYVKAVELFTVLLNKYKVSELYFERGTTYSQCGDFDNSIVDLTEAIALNSCDADSYVNRGNAYLRKEQYQSAIEDFEQALQLSPCLVFAHNSRAYACQRLGRIDDAINGFLCAIELDKSYGSPYFNLGALFFEIGRLDDAFTYLRVAKRLLPNDDEVLSLLKDVRKEIMEGKEGK